MFVSVLVTTTVAAGTEAACESVTDSQAASVPAATVVVTNTETNISSRLVTNNGGYYEAQLLLPGRYQVTVESPGFKKFVRPGLTLAQGERMSIDAQLEIGAIGESVTVTAESPILDTSSVTSGRVMTTRELMDLPV